MPSIYDHSKQYDSNKSLLDKLLSLNPKPNDWIVTVAFYAALHIIEKRLAQSNQHLKSHESRNKFIETSGMFDDVSVQYHSLYLESKRARYACVNITEKKAQHAISLLNQIEKRS